MKLIIAFLSTLALAFANNPGPPDKFALGGMAGTIWSVTGKYWISKPAAIDFGLGFGNPGTAIYADYLWHIPGLFGTGYKWGRETSAYFGGGIGLGFWDDDYECGRWHCDRRARKSGNGLFIRGMFGFEWFAKPTRFGVFGEAGPTFLLSPASGSGIDVGVGGRFYF